MLIKEEVIPDEVRAKANIARTQYSEIYLKIMDLQKGLSIAIECDDEDEAKKINNAVRQWSYRTAERDDDNKVVALPVKIIRDEAVVWVEKKV